MRLLTIPVLFAAALALFAQESKSPDASMPKNYRIETGTHIPLSLINSVSTKNAIPGDRVYLETVFPILADGRIVIPPGSYVAGTITEIKRPGRVKGRGEFHLRFDSLTLPNGATRDFRAHVTGLDGLFDRGGGREARVADPFDGLVSLFGLFQGGIVPSYPIIIREHFPPTEAGARVGTVLMFPLFGMALGGWLSGKVFDLTGSYQAAFINGIGWNLLNLTVALLLLRRSRGRGAGTAAAAAGIRG